MKRLLSLLLVVATTLSAAACGDSSTGPAGSLAGTYNIVSLRGQTQFPVSLVYTNAQDHVEIVSSQITLYSNGTYTDVTRIRDTYYGPTEEFEDRTDGNWTLSGSDLTLQDRNDFSHVTYARVNNNRLVIDNFADYGVTAEYAK